jgi:hypothetical protein
MTINKGDQQCLVGSTKERVGFILVFFNFTSSKKQGQFERDSNLGNLGKSAPTDQLPPTDEG